MPPLVHLKQFEATVNVRYPTSFCSDKDRNLMTALSARYNGRCFMGCQVLRVVQVVRASACRYSSTNIAGEAYIDVCFQAEVVVYAAWDILVGVRVVMSEQFVCGTYESRPGPQVLGEAVAQPRSRAVVGISATRAAEVLAEGLDVAVRVATVSHAPMQTDVVVSAVLLVCDQAAPVYRLRGALDQAARVELAPMLAAVDAELAARAELVSARRADVWFFEQLLYSYRNPSGAKALPDESVGAGLVGAEGEVEVPAWTGPARLRGLEEGAAQENVLELIRRALSGEAVAVAGYWSRSLSLYRSSPLVARASSTAPPTGWPAECVECAPRVAFAEWLKNILDFLAAVREMADLYDSAEKLRAHTSLWAAMRAAQAPAQGVAQSAAPALASSPAVAEASAPVMPAEEAR